MRGKGRARSALGLMLIVFALAMLGGLSLAAFFLRPPPTDSETLCRTDAPLAAHTIVLVDSTDRLETRHRRKLRAVMAQERARLAQYERLTLMRLNVRRPQEPSILFSRCLPRPPELANPLFENARHAQQRWDEAFAGALDRALRTAATGRGAQASPIIAGVRAVAADPDFGAEIARRRLVLVSDMLEHEPGVFSHYTSGATFEAWQARPGREPADLEGVALRIVPLDRPDHGARQSEAMALFWAPYFAAASVETVSIDPAP